MDYFPTKCWNVAVVLSANELENLFIRQFGDPLLRPGLGENARVVNRDFDFQMAEIGAMVALDDVQFIGVRMRFLIQPNSRIERRRDPPPACRRPNGRSNARTRPGWDRRDDRGHPDRSDGSRGFHRLKYRPDNPCSGRTPTAGRCAAGRMAGNAPAGYPCRCCRGAAW